MEVSVIGLGRMGSGMASTLLRAGHRVKGGYDVSRQAMERLSGSGNFTAASGWQTHWMRTSSSSPCPQERR